MPTMVHVPATLGVISGIGEVGDTGAESATAIGSVPLVRVRLGSAARRVGGRGEAAALALAAPVPGTLAMP